MALIKLNNRSVKDATAFGSITALGSLTFISKQTASSSASISFTGIDSSYKEYVFYFNNIHPQTNGATFDFQGSTNGGSSYGVTITSTSFRAYHSEGDTGAVLSYHTSSDLAQSTSYQQLFAENLKNDNDSSGSGYLHLFNPSSTTYVKHFIFNGNFMYPYTDISINQYVAGYFNTTSAIDAIDFKMNTGNVDDGTISLFGVN